MTILIIQKPFKRLEQFTCSDHGAKTSHTHTHTHRSVKPFGYSSWTNLHHWTQPHLSLPSRMALVRSGRFVSSSSRRGRTTGYQSIPHPSWLSSVGWRRATRLTQDPSSPTAGRWQLLCCQFWLKCCFLFAQRSSVGFLWSSDLCAQVGQFYVPLWTSWYH